MCPREGTDRKVPEKETYPHEIDLGKIWMVT